MMEEKVEAIPEPGEDSDGQSQPNIARTVLPAPIAAVISLATSASAFTLRVGGFFGNAAINTARLGTLTGFELCRAVLEGVLSRAGQDVVETSAGRLGRIAAESVLERALLTVHTAIIHTSFLVSTGFQIGSTGMAAGLNVSQYFLSALNAVLGDTETSKAIASIILMVQREFRNPETGRKEEKVGLGDIITGIIGFALLQRWAEDKTNRELEYLGVEEVVWDLVVVADDRKAPVNGQLLIEDRDADGDVQMDIEDDDIRPSSSLSMRRDPDELTTFSYDENASVVSHRPHGNPQDSSERPEQAFRQYLHNQLNPGASVRISARSVKTNTVTVEVLGGSKSDIQAPKGYELVVNSTTKGMSGRSQRLVFQNSNSRQKSARFQIQGSHQLGCDELSHFNAGNLQAQHPSPVGIESQNHAQYMKSLEEGLIPVKANQKKLRSNTAASEAHVEPKQSLKSALKSRTSYKNLFEFWNGQSAHKTGKRSSKQQENVQASSQPHDQFETVSAQSPFHTQGERLSVFPNFDKRRGSISRQSMDNHERPSSRRSHKKDNASIYTLASNSEASLVLHHASGDQRDRMSLMLNRNGRLSGQYPYQPFATNAARFARFSAAAYGSSFLRLTGSVMNPQGALMDADVPHLAEHRSFSSYNRLPASTVLLSSFVDAQGGSNSAGETESGMPLVHYISLDHASKAVVLTCRGTLGFEDVLTDMTCDYGDFEWLGKTYQVHKGMLASALRILTMHNNRVVATIKSALEENVDYGLVLCGHSLGGGVTALLAMMLAVPSVVQLGNSSAFITGTHVDGVRMDEAMEESNASADYMASTLPAGRSIHVYAYGPPATVCPSLQRVSRGLVTTIIHGQDHIPYLSLGTLRDLQAIALAFKTDSGEAKGEVRKRVWDGLWKALGNSTGLDASLLNWPTEEQDEDHWPWVALKSLRSNMLALKLVPPGEVFHVHGEQVYKRHAFVGEEEEEEEEAEATRTRSFRPATRVKVTHIEDVERRFGEIRFGASMYLDHIPARYEKVLETLARGIGG